MIKDRSKVLLEKQQSLDNRLRKQQFQASRQASAYGLTSSDKQTFVNQRISEYKQVELIRRSVNDVKKRGQDLEKQRKLQGKAYEGIKSKVARNMKVINMVKKANGVSPAQKQKELGRTQKRDASPISSKGPTTQRDVSWERNCTNHRGDTSRTLSSTLKVDRSQCCCRCSRSPMSTRSRLDVVNDYASNLMNNSVSYKSLNKTMASSRLGSTSVLSKTKKTSNLTRQQQLDKQQQRHDANVQNWASTSMLTTSKSAILHKEDHQSLTQNNPEEQIVKKPTPVFKDYAKNQGLQARRRSKDERRQASVEKKRQSTDNYLDDTVEFVGKAQSGQSMLKSTYSVTKTSEVVGTPQKQQEEAYQGQGVTETTTKVYMSPSQGMRRSKSLRKQQSVDKQETVTFGVGAEQNEDAEDIQVSPYKEYTSEQDELMFSKQLSLCSSGSGMRRKRSDRKPNTIDVKRKDAPIEGLANQNENAYTGNKDSRKVSIAFSSSSKSSAMITPVIPQDFSGSVIKTVTKTVKMGGKPARTSTIKVIKSNVSSQDFRTKEFRSYKV